MKRKLTPTCRDFCSCQNLTFTLKKMNTLQLFECTDFKGDSVTLDGDNPDLSSLGFLQRAQSLKVHGEPWIVYSEVKYGHGHDGEFECFRQGSYSSLSSWNNKISSVRHVKGGLSNPKITLYDYANYEGKQVTLTQPEESLKKFGFEKRALSHAVAAGAWILYSEENFTGDQMITLAGDKVPDYSDFSWNGKLTSAKPIPADGK